MDFKKEECQSLNSRKDKFLKIGWKKYKYV